VQVSTLRVSRLGSGSAELSPEAQTLVGGIGTAEGQPQPDPSGDGDMYQCGKSDVGRDFLIAVLVSTNVRTVDKAGCSCLSS